MPKPYTLDLSAFPPDLAAVIGLHRQMFGDTRMEADAAPAAPAVAPVEAPAAVPVPTPPPATPAPQAPAQPATGTIDDLPEYAQKIIRDLRKEAASNRVAAKATPAEPDTTPSPAVAAAEDRARAAEARLAVHTGAGALGANPALLLRDAPFLTALKGVDPADPAQIKAAIVAALKDSPHLSAAPAAPKRGGVEFTGGTGEPITRKSKGLKAAIAGHYGS